MNKKNADRWEVRLGIAQVIILLGVVTGCMTFAFYLGFFSGSQSGYDLGMESNATSNVKIPIGAAHQDSEVALHKTEQAVSEVYARLNDRNKDSGKAEGGATDQIVPELSSIKEAENPLNDPWDTKPAANPQKEEKVLADDAASLFADEETKKEPKPDVSKGLADKKGEDSNKALEAKSVEAATEELHEAKKVDLKHEEATKEDLKKEELKKEEAKKIEAKKEEAKKLEAQELAKKEAAKKEELKKAEAKKVDEKKLASADSAGITRGAIPGGWYAQVAAPTKRADAEEVANKLKQSGFHVVIENAQVRGDDYFRILVGPEKNKAQAEALVGQVRRESFIKGMPFIRMVK